MIINQVIICWREANSSTVICRTRLPAPTQLDDQVPDTCYWYKITHSIATYMNLIQQETSDLNAECYKDMLLFNIWLANKSLFWGHSSPVTKLWRCSPFNHWAMLVRLLSYFYLQHNIHAPRSLNFCSIQPLTGGLQIFGYQTFCKDRNWHGGGVLVYVHVELDCSTSIYWLGIIVALSTSWQFQTNFLSSPECSYWYSWSTTKFSSEY